MTRRHLAVIAVLAGGTAGLVALGHGILGAPAADPATWSDWLAQRGPATAAMAILRLVALAVHAYLLLAVAMAATGDPAVRPRPALPLPAGLRAALAPRALVPKVLAPGVGVSLALGTVAPPAPDSTTDPSRPGTAVMEPLAADSSDATGPGADAVARHRTAAEPGRDRTALDAPARSTTGPGEPSPPQPDVAVTPAPGPAPVAAAGPSSVPAPPPSQVPTPAPAASEPAPMTAGPGNHSSRTVQAGDSLWRLAEEEMGDRLGRAPTERETAGYWRTVVAANRHRIRSGDPDVLHPGETVILPR